MLYLLFRRYVTANTSTELNCVIVGDAQYADNYIASRKRMAEDDSRVILTGYVFGKGYHELGSNAYATNAVYRLCQVQLPEWLQGRREFHGRIH